MFKNSSATSPAKVRRLERASRAFQLRKAGYDYQDIADIIEAEWEDAGLSTELPDSWGKRFARKDVMNVMTDLRNTMAESVLEIVELDLSRLDDMLASVWTKAIEGKYEAIDRVLKIMDRKARIVGYDKSLNSSDWRLEILELLETGKITMAQVRKELGDELATQFVEFINSESVGNRKTQGAIEIRPPSGHSEDLY